jgi:hypothetical protein
MASGNHVWNPICADLPIEPKKKKNTISSIKFILLYNRYIVSIFIKFIKLIIIIKLRLLYLYKINKIPNIKKTSAILFINIAFIAALFANTLLYQKFINK